MTLHLIIEAAVHWVHVLAAITWVGQTFLFSSFERRLETIHSDENVAGRMWMVHGGAFYLLEKQRVPEIMPMKLQWFKWGAAITWVSGAVLLGLRFYVTGIVVGPGTGKAVSMMVGVGSIIVSWLAYDLFVQYVASKDGRVFAALGLIFTLALHLTLRKFLSDPAAYIHVGAVLGTIMAANVWLRILPSHRSMIKHAESGSALEFLPPESGALRSKHNSYLAIPLVFIMIGNHYPWLTYASAYPTVALGAVLAVGWAVVRLIRGR
jgi:uncharacterized membrane protein